MTRIDDASLIRALCAAVADQLGVSADPRFHVVVDGPGARGIWLLTLSFRGAEARIVHARVSRHPDWQWVAYQLAYQWQDEVIDDVREARPVCAGHPHPMSAEVRDDGIAVWVCPQASHEPIPIWNPSL